MKDVFSRLAPFIQDYIYAHEWEAIRPIQIAACEAIWETDHNVVLASGTASGKTEAAFLPILTQLDTAPSTSVGILYISPLKALINDQFERIEDMLKETDIPVTKWHGDVSQTMKAKLVKKPRGILQITPESLEAMLMRNRGNVIQLFHDLRYIVIDEVHYFMHDDRGIQLLCLLERIQKLIGKIPRRIGLSATLGDYTAAKQWLSAGTNRECVLPQVPEEKRKIGLKIAYFSGERQETQSYYTYLYEKTLGKKCIVFANAKADVEESIAHLKRIAKERHSKDVYFVHHANVATSLRKQAEEEMKREDTLTVTGATLTLELGIDVGKLDRIVQIGAPYTVSSFVQRLGRCGRRGQMAEMLFLCKRDTQEDKAPFYKVIDFALLKTIAILTLYLEDKWIEPIETNTLPYSLLYHQTMSHLFSVGCASPKELASTILTLSPFQKITRQDYQALLRFWIEKKEIEKDEEGNLLIGEQGEKKVNVFQFFSVFEEAVEYAVRCDGQEIGTVQALYPVGETFSLAGFTWRVVEVQEEKRQIFVKKTNGVAKVAWNGEFSNFVPTKVMHRVKRILEEAEGYRFLDEEGSRQLESMRRVASLSGITKKNIVQLTENMFAIFPWLGTKEMLGLSFALTSQGIENAIHYEAGLPLLIAVKANSEGEVADILETVQKKSIEKEEMTVPEDMERPGKYNYYIPKPFLKKQFLEDCVHWKFDN